MDVGRFERSRLTRWAWIATPLVLIVIAVLPSRFFLTRTGRALAERKVVLESVAPVEDRLRMVTGVLKSLLADAGHGAEATDEATRRINQAAQRGGFSIRSLNVDKSVGQAGQLKTYRISVRGEGPLVSVINWLNDIQRSDAPLRVEAAKVTCLGLPPDTAVSGEFTLILFLRPS